MIVLVVVVMIWLWLFGSTSRDKLDEEEVVVSTLTGVSVSRGGCISSCGGSGGGGGGGGGN